VGAGAAGVSGGGDETVWLGAEAGVAAVNCVGAAIGVDVDVVEVVEVVDGALARAGGAAGWFVDAASAWFERVLGLIVLIGAPRTSASGDEGSAEGDRSQAESSTAKAAVVVQAATARSPEEDTRKFISDRSVTGFYCRTGFPAMAVLGRVRVDGIDLGGNAPRLTTSSKRSQSLIGPGTR